MQVRSAVILLLQTDGQTDMANLKGEFDMILYYINCNWVVTRWQQYSTHLHTNNTQNDTKQTIHRTTQQFGTVRTVPRLG